MKTITLFTLFLLIGMLAAPIATAQTIRQWRTGVAMGADPNGEYAAATLTRNWFPVRRDLSWGVRTYGELGAYDYDGDRGNAVTLGVEPVLTWRGCYAGMGMSIGNTTPRLGTVANFSSTGGCDFELNNGMSLGAFVNHRSHGSRLGIAEDKENGGVTTFNVILTW
jgi:hypothetical protein